MFVRQIGPVELQLTTGDIVKQADCDAIVNAANAELRPGSGVAGAIHRAAGPELDRECRALAPIKPGQAVITSGHRLPNRWVIHCLGPVYGRDEPARDLLASCYREALRLADEHRVRAIAFPSISTGAFGYPMDAAARVALATISERAPSLQHVRLIRLVLFDARALEVHERALEDIAEG